jgi:hypothetical protein
MPSPNPLPPHPPTHPPTHPEMPDMFGLVLKVQSFFCAKLLHALAEIVMWFQSIVKHFADSSHEVLVNRCLLSSVFCWIFVFEATQIFANDKIINRFFFCSYKCDSQQM